jgi:hypothetical protein
MNDKLKTAGFAAVAVLAVAICIYMLVKTQGASDTVNVREVDRRELSNLDKARMRAGWTYDVKSKRWYDENFRPVADGAAPNSAR